VENIEESRDKGKGREKGEKLKEKKSPSQSKERAMGILNEMFVHTFGLGSVVGVSLVCVPDRVSRPSDAPATSTARAHGYRDRKHESRTVLYSIRRNQFKMKKVSAGRRPE
jgi:hypothetical protein